MRRLATATAAVVWSLFIPAGALAQPPALPALPAPVPLAKDPDPTYTIALKTRHACVTPHAHNLARVEGGFIDVVQSAPQMVMATLTGTTAANSYLGCTGTATETFELVQDFEVTSSDPRVRTVALTLETALAGFVRSKGRAGAAMRRAEVSVTPVDRPGMPMGQSYPALIAEGTSGQLCNQHLPPLEVPAMPVGRYTLVAKFVLDSRASGVCDSHAVADFSPDTTLPADWVRTRDPFQGVSKKSFGFTITVTAAPPSAGPPVSAIDGDRPPLAQGRAAPVSEPAANRRIRRTSL